MLQVNLTAQEFSKFVMVAFSKLPKLGKIFLFLHCLGIDLFLPENRTSGNLGPANIYAKSMKRPAEVKN